VPNTAASAREIGVIPQSPPRSGVSSDKYAGTESLAVLDASSRFQ